MLPDSLCFVDLETTGTSTSFNRIIEIGIIRVEKGQIVKTYKQLINPQTGSNPFITNLTGIETKDLEKAPTFNEVKREVLDLLTDSLFIAHNARFDYGFLRNEFRRHDISFTAKHLCTVKLARILYPELPRHNLETIIQTFNLNYTQRHRAFDDAQVLWEFYQIAQKQHGPEVFLKAITKVLKKPTIPISLTQETLDGLPETPGVYLFYGESSMPIYIGKSINIRNRVLSHFSNDYLLGTDMKIAQQVTSIETISTAGELGALLLESTLIKKYQPLFNRRLRQSRKMIILSKIKTSEGYNSVEEKTVDEISLSDSENILGTFRTKKQIKDFLSLLVKQYQLCPKLCGLEKAKTVCFHYQLGYCPGACKQKETTLKYNLRFDEAFYKYKIRPWKFAGPILIKEEGESKEGFIVDKWCLLGSIKKDEELSNISHEYRFDMDTYKIINKFLLEKNKKIVVTLLDYPLINR